MVTVLPTDSQERKGVPLARGCLDYFPAALAEVARLSLAGNEKHNPGEELHHSRGKSSDHADCIIRHLSERGTVDTDGFLHDVKIAWRSLANLQETLERLGLAPLARGARLETPVDGVQTTRAISPGAPRPLPAPAKAGEPCISETCLLPAAYSHGFGCPIIGACFGSGIPTCPYSRHIQPSF